MIIDLFALYNTTLGVGAVLLQLGVLFLIFVKLFPRRAPKWVTPFFTKHGLLIALVLACFGFFSPLVYSEIVGLEPCKLCWYQRIYMFPQIVLLGIAYIRKETAIRFYVIPLAVIGAFVSVYHYLMQFSVVETSSCGVVGQSAGGCGSVFIQMFGYITIPLMAFTIFMSIIWVLLSIQKSV